MKKVLTFIIAIAVLGSLQAQSVDEILDKHFEVTGGKDNWAKLKTMRTEADMSMQGMEFAGTILSKYPNKQRVNVNINGTSLIQAYDGETAWWINPFAGGTEPQVMPAEMAESMTRQDFESAFLNYQEKGHTVELIGEKEVEGAAAYEVKLTKKNGDVEMHYFDKQDFVTIKIAMTMTTGQAKGQIIETFLSDYSEVEGIVVPFSMEVKMDGQTLQKLTFKEVVLNEEMEDSLFAYPKK